MHDLLSKYASLNKKWTPSEVEVWRKKRAQGMFRFILLEGVLKWGGLSFTFFCLFNLVMNLPYEKSIFSDFLFTTLVWVIASSVYGYIVWIGTNRAFHSKFSPDEIE